MDYRTLIRDATERFATAGIDTPTLDSELLLAHAAGVSRTEIFTHPERIPDADTVLTFADWVDRRERREPLAYIIGEWEFYGITFTIAPGVLVPRPETEILVETALLYLKHRCSPAVADIGVGSGALAVAIAKNAPNAEVFGTDTSETAIELTRANAERTQVEDRVEIRAGDLLSPLSGLYFDLIVSNPPYIKTDDIPKLQPEVALFEPKGALDGGADGLDYYRRLAKDAPSYLKPGGALCVEVGAGEAKDVQEIFAAGGLVNLHTVCDYSAIERVVCGEKA